MAPAALQRENLVILGTIWTLTRFEAFRPYPVTTYKSGHYFRGEKEGQKKLPNLVILGTIWALTRFEGFRPYPVTTYKSGHWIAGEKEGQKMGYAMSAVYAALYEEFLEAQRPRVSGQGFTSLQGRARRMLFWFESQEIDLSAVSIQDAVRYQASLCERRTERGEPISTGAVHNYLKAARAFFGHLARTGRIASNPFMELRYPRLGEHLSRNGLTEAQMGRLLGELSRFDEVPTYRAALRRYRTHVVAEFLYATGMRIAEACTLTESKLDLEHRLVYIAEGKGGKSRTAFLTPYAAEVMKRYLERGRRAVLGHYGRMHGETLFGSDKARVAAVVNEELEGLCRDLELPKITTHGFRHSLGTHLLRSGCDMRHIQAILGHESLNTTQVYTKVDKDDLKRSLDEHHPRRWLHAGSTP